MWLAGFFFFFFLATSLGGVYETLWRRQMCVFSFRVNTEQDSRLPSAAESSGRFGLHNVGIT